MIGVFGANGFIGRHVVNSLIAAGLPVRAVSRKFDRDIAQAWAGKVDLVEADFNNTLSMLSCLDGIKTVIQLISSSSPSMGNRAVIEDIQENIIPHVSFMRYCVQEGVKRYIFISSGGTIYGADTVFPTPETSSPAPLGSHGMTKLTIENYLQMFGRAEGLAFTILRVSNPFGPGQIFRRGQGLIPAILQQHAAGLPVSIFGDGLNERDYLYVSDLADAVRQAAILPAVNTENRIFNIGSGETQTILDVMDAIESVMGITLQKKILPARQTDVRKSMLDITQAKAALNWAPKVAFEDGVRTMLVD